ncbi:vancomycin high temperature exclusion protein [Subsaximicrobium wynnwilliamsii]|uniref:Vancomycin high temperature exclusion protein n=1 Tax=Subsaximicrobium wynnwilliamsii TaxID=291179 RepID=A0A5C6ZCU5_9FLAO|nr:ElyC/SanA/YdcF family protein [Subsaximicrobium wynnwilliamsii]TXD82015.1 vancomycin high temperature exclusion protein [Subsaximicrobium wynnwilliamsii]TXD86893.1 vancomycin high temperature exclusion protein [Subsaximicrobium wynnwilliamsii]TXE01475.1 vancomycin high temperature exclusion protein [Subsaximicrobium wynnwilliamsii]
MKKLKLLLLAVVFVLLGVITTNYWVAFKASGHVYDDLDLIPTNKVGMVLGTSKYVSGGNINLFYTYRIEATVKLYQAGKIEFVLISGDNGSKYYDEPNTFKKDLIEKGIPEAKIFLDFAGFRTLDSVVRVKAVFGQDEVTIISQKFHNQRAIYLAQNYNIKAVGFNARDVSGKGGLKVQLREYLARAKASIDILFDVEPKFLGENVEIE